MCVKLEQKYRLQKIIPKYFERKQKAERRYNKYQEEFIDMKEDSHVLKL